MSWLTLIRTKGCRVGGLDLVQAAAHALPPPCTDPCRRLR